MKDFTDFLYGSYIEPIVRPVEVGAARAEKWGFFINAIFFVVSLFLLYLTVITRSWWLIYVTLHMPADFLAAKYAWDAERDDDDDDGPWGWIG